MVKTAGIDCYPESSGTTSYLPSILAVVTLYPQSTQISARRPALQFTHYKELVTEFHSCTSRWPGKRLQPTVPGEHKQRAEHQHFRYVGPTLPLTVGSSAPSRLAVPCGVNTRTEPLFQVHSVDNGADVSQEKSTGFLSLS